MMWLLASVRLFLGMVLFLGDDTCSWSRVMITLERLCTDCAVIFQSIDEKEESVTSMVHVSESFTRERNNMHRAASV